MGPCAPARRNHLGLALWGYAIDGDTLSVAGLITEGLALGALAQLEEWRAHLTAFLDHLSSGVLVVSVGGRVLHETPMLARMLADDPERDRLRRALLDAAYRIGAGAHHRCGAALPPAPFGARATHEERTATARYRLWGSYVGAGLLAPAGTVIAVLERVLPQPLSDAQLRDRFGLTRRELEVAHLVGRGASALEIAHALGISTHTARHHLERVRSKLGSHRIGETAARIRDAQAEPLTGSPAPESAPPRAPRARAAIRSP
jgi:DNA-binding CsgD family transcriptional regulator